MASTSLYRKSTIATRPRRNELKCLEQRTRARSAVPLFQVRLQRRSHLTRRASPIVSTLLYLDPPHLDRSFDGRRAVNFITTPLTGSSISSNGSRRRKKPRKSKSKMPIQVSTGGLISNQTSGSICAAHLVPNSATTKSTPSRTLTRVHS